MKCKFLILEAMSGFAPNLNREIAIASCRARLVLPYFKRVGGILLPLTASNVFWVACYE